MIAIRAHVSFEATRLIVDFLKIILDKISMSRSFLMLFTSYKTTGIIKNLSPVRL